jgi:predicted ester cyclase
MTIEDNKTFIQRFIDEVFNAGNTDAIADFCVPGSLLASGLEGQVMSLRTSFPDIHFTIDEMVAEADKVAVRTTMRGTNSGPLVGLPAFGRLEQPVPPTGASVMSTTTYIFTFSDGKITSFTRDLDQIGVLQQLGWTITPPGQT